MEKTAYEALIDFINNSKEMNDASLFLLRNSHKTTKVLWRAINALEDLNEVLPGLVEEGLLSEKAMSSVRSAKWQVIEELEPVAHNALKAERKFLPEKAKECQKRLMDD